MNFNGILEKIKSILSFKSRQKIDTSPTIDFFEGGKQKSQTKQLYLLVGLIAGIIALIAIMLPSEKSAGHAGGGGLDTQKSENSTTSQSKNFSNPTPPKLDITAFDFDSAAVNEFLENNVTVVNTQNENNTTSQNITIELENTVSIITMNDENYDEMKNYLNNIKHLITINGDSFVYDSKQYRIGNTINTYLIQDITEHSIQFKNSIWQYTLREIKK
jgi:hypothetical protein